MTYPLTFTIPGRPKPWQRVSWVRGHSWDSNKAHKKVIASYAYAALVAHKDSILGPKYTGKVAMHFYFVGCHGKADFDNLMKMVSDALQGILYVNDNQITEGKFYKLDGKQRETQITVYPLPRRTP